MNEGFLSRHYIDQRVQDILENHEYISEVILAKLEIDLPEFDKLGKYNKGNEKYDKLYDVNIKLLDKDYKRISRFSKTELLHFMKVRYDLNISSIKKKDAMNIIREKEDKEER